MIFINDTTIKADEGMKLTNGTTFGDTVYIGKNDSADNWHEITEAEAERLQSDATEPTDTEATEADYINALEDLGVKFDE